MDAADDRPERVGGAALLVVQEDAAPLVPLERHHAAELPAREAHPPAVPLAERDVVFRNEADEAVDRTLQPFGQTTRIGVGDTDVRSLAAVPAAGAAELQQLLPPRTRSTHPQPA
jgi:hypothetical protein